MEIRHRQWTGLGAIAVAGCLLLAIGCALAATAVGSQSLTSKPLAMESAITAPAPIACASELYAFMKVAEAARDLGSDRNILNFALDDLQANLADCLKGDGDADRRDATNEMAAPRRFWFRDV
jgi:hypothetical protein